MRIKILKGTVVSVLLTVMAGCSTMNSFEIDATCVAVGATVGGAAGGVTDGDNAVKGAIGGALVGALACHFLDGDDDSDGVKNSSDKCPGTPLGAQVNSEGCSVSKRVAIVDIVEPVSDLIVTPTPADEDLDGIVDAKDLCAGTPAGSAVDEKGCPPVQNIVLEGVAFEFDSAILTPQASKVLTQQAEILKENPAIKISVTGHTDNFGGEKYNQILSLQRARAVRNFFIGQGIDSSIVTVSGAGELEPIADNVSILGRSVNRRVELKVIRKEG
ncbi:OmpA family protein [Parendozoicomonas sp. Alg238-R29]|uniref:OmpA family protein n=1 Tax=Parendozoicomonas sp. Alg238-R29 TaxID=2993446 RepID=UPI00248D492F|nr:OmpA family protein [Parendozoicomonas sp. Alg238-R29]